MLPLKSLSVRARLAAPAITSRSWRLAATCSARQRRDRGDERSAVRAGTAPAKPCRARGRIREREAAELGVEPAAQLGEELVVEASVLGATSRRCCSTRPVSVMNTVMSRVGPSATSSMWRTRALPNEGYCTSATWLVSCESRRTVRDEHVVEIDRLAEEGLDRLALRRRQRTQVGELVDEDPIALVGRHATGRGVRRRDQLLLFEQRHVVADGRGRHAEGVPLDDRLRADRLARGDVVLHDDAEHLEAAVGDHEAPPSVRLRSRRLSTRVA